MRAAGVPAPVRPSHAPSPWRRRRLTVPPAVVAAQPAHAPTVTVQTVAAHVLDAHGFPYHVVDAATETDLMRWHAAEHRFRTPEALRHTHTAVNATTTDPVLAAKLTAVSEGRHLPDIEEILDRAEYARGRRDAGLVLSRYDLDCLAIAKAAADRDARRAARRRTA